MCGNSRERKIPTPPVITNFNRKVTFPYLLFSFKHANNFTLWKCPIINLGLPVSFLNKYNTLDPRSLSRILETKVEGRKPILMSHHMDFSFNDERCLLGYFESGDIAKELTLVSELSLHVEGPDITDIMIVLKFGSVS